MAPNDPSATDPLAEMKRLIAERHYGDAIVRGRQLLVTGGEQPELRVMLGEALLAEGRYDDVRVEMLAVIRGTPELGAAHRVLGEAFLRAGQKERAEDSLRRALDLSPDDEQTRGLLDELAEEKFPVAQTIERWFGDDEGRTVETESPAFAEEHTPVPAPASTFAAPREIAVPIGVARPIAIEPSIQVDPALEAEAQKWASESVASILGEDGAAETADTTMPTGPPARAEGLRHLLEKAAPPRKPFVPAPTIARAPSPAIATLRGPEGTAVARPNAKEGAVVIGPAALDGGPSKGGAPSKGVAKVPSPNAARVPLPVAVEPAAAPLPAPPPRPAPAALEPSGATQQSESPGPTDGPTAELAIAELDDRELDVAPPPIEDVDDAELTRPLPAMDAAERPLPVRPLSARPPSTRTPSAAPPPARPTGPLAPPPSRPPPALGAPPLAPPPPRSVPPPAAGPPRSAPPPPRPAPLRAEDPRALPSFPPIAGPPPSAAGQLAAIPVAPAPSVAAGGPLLPTAPEISAPPSSAPATALAIPVPPTAAHAPLGGGPEPSVGFAIAPPAAPTGIDRRTLAIGIGAALLSLTLLIATVIACSGPSDLEIAMATASFDGRPASYEAAIALAPADGDDAERASRALLLAITTIELGIDRIAECEAVLATLEGEASTSPEARVARALAALAQGRGGQGLTFLSGLSTTGPTLSEAFRARALVLAQVGTVTEAVDAARQAATLAPGSPRHAALYAELSVLARDDAGAQRVLDGIVGIDGLATLRVARAELLLMRGADATVIRADVDALLGPLVGASTAPELGRAHLVAARLALSSGDAATARGELELAATLIPSFDGRRRRELADSLLAAGAASRALEVARALSGETSETTARATTVVRAALAAGDLTAAEAAVDTAGTGPVSDLLRAQIHEARGRPDDARRLYSLAAVDPTLMPQARTAEGRLFYLAGRTREAVAALEPALAARPTDGDTVLWYVRAALATGALDGAERAAAVASSAAPDDPEVLAAAGLVARARGRLDAATTALERAAAALPDDAHVRLDLADLALVTGRLDVAEREIGAATPMPASGARAGLLAITLALERGDTAGAEATLGRLSGATADELAHARARLLVARGDGAASTTEVARMRSGHASDPILAVALATLYEQAEDERAARRFVDVSLRADRRGPEALVLSALIYAHAGRGQNARDALATAEESIASRGALPSIRARLSAVRGRIAFDDGDFAAARAAADAAIALDPRCAEAHLVIADLEVEASRDPVPALRSAVAGTQPLGEAFGRLALRLGPTEEGCGFGRRFVAVAPRGYDARDVRDLLERCP